MLIAGGIGVTAMRALLEDLPRSTRPLVILRVSRDEDAVLKEELAELARKRGGKLQVIVGSRDKARLDADRLRQLVPGILGQDVYVCGPEEFVRDMSPSSAASACPPTQSTTRPTACRQIRRETRSCDRSDVLRLSSPPRWSGLSECSASIPAPRNWP